jgi:hypothetical protein
MSKAGTGKAGACGAMRGGGVPGWRRGRAADDDEHPAPQSRAMKIDRNSFVSGHPARKVRDGSLWTRISELDLATGLRLDRDASACKTRNPHLISLTQRIESLNITTVRIYPRGQFVSRHLAADGMLGPP